eukprot:SM000001S04802  [mRNA]  locus=s1:2205988:2210397:- [translate_table: standard]
MAAASMRLAAGLATVAAPALGPSAEVPRQGQVVRSPPRPSQSCRALDCLTQHGHPSGSQAGAPLGQRKQWRMRPEPRGSGPDVASQSAAAGMATAEVDDEAVATAADAKSTTQAEDALASQTIGVKTKDLPDELIESMEANGVPVGTVQGQSNGAPMSSTLIEVDSVAEADLKENGHMTLLTGLSVICISYQNVKKLNMEKGYSLAIMMDTEGSEIHMGDLGGAPSEKAEDGEEWIFTVRKFAQGTPLPKHNIQVNYDGFIDDVREGDEVVIDGGMVRFEVLGKVGPDVRCRCVDPGLLLPRANLTFFRQGRLVRERNAMLPTISSKDWIDIDFGIGEGVDFLAVSFVRSPDVIKHLRSYCDARSPTRPICIIAKIESSDSLKCLEEIISVSDGAMVARGDLGAQIPLEQVPSVQQEIVSICRQLNKPVIVASQLLESMIEFPTPTRAEVADISEAVRQRADALMLSGESAMGQYPDKALAVLRTVSLRIEKWCRDEKHHENMRLESLSSQLSERISEQICNSAAQMANQLGVNAIFVYTRRGYMASLLSRNRPDCPIFAFTDSKTVRRRLNLYWGLIPFEIQFSDDMEANLRRTFVLLKARGMMKSGDLVVAVTDVVAEGVDIDLLQSIQVRKIP